MATRYSSRSRPSSRVRPKPKPAVTSSVPAAATSEASSKKSARSESGTRSSKKNALKPPDLDTILNHFSDSLALVETAFAALDAAQEDWDVTCCGSDISPAVLTLQFGIKDLQRLRGDLDRAIFSQRRA